jgi:beta-glucanase (GH16 family)
MLINVILIRPAIWMLPKYSAYGGWPASGEIDIVSVHASIYILLLTDFVDGISRKSSISSWEHV